MCWWSTTISLGATSALDPIAPHSDALHVIQRFHRVSYDTLEDELTLDDPKAFTHPGEKGTAVFKAAPIGSSTNTSARTSAC